MKGADQASQNAKFFALPQEVKEKVPHPPEGWWHRGYSGIGREKVSQMVFDAETLSTLRNIPDVKESFEMGRETDTHLRNIWLPESDLPGFRSFFNNFYNLCNDLELEILRALALGMDLNEHFFDTYHKNADNQTRILHYPPVEESILRLGKKERIAAHSDFGTITILFQDKIGGLEVENPMKKGEFTPVPCIPGTIIVNIGDFMMRWSNDILKSTLHRVRAPPLIEGEDNNREKMTPARYSIPYFCSADKDVIIECLPGCWGPERPKRYEPITAGEYVAMRLNATY